MAIRPCGAFPISLFLASRHYLPLFLRIQIVWQFPWWFLFQANLIFLVFVHHRDCQLQFHKHCLRPPTRPTLYVRWSPPGLEGLWVYIDLVLINRVALISKLDQTVDSGQGSPPGQRSKGHFPHRFSTNGISWLCQLWLNYELLVSLVIM